MNDIIYVQNIGIGGHGPEYMTILYFELIYQLQNKETRVEVKKYQVDYFK